MILIMIFVLCIFFLLLITLFGEHFLSSWKGALQLFVSTIVFQILISFILKMFLVNPSLPIVVSSFMISCASLFGGLYLFVLFNTLDEE